MKIKISSEDGSVTLKSVDLTLFADKTREFGFPVDPPDFVYHVAIFSEHGTFWIHPRRFQDPQEASVLRGEVAAIGEVDPEEWFPLIQFNQFLHSLQGYNAFIHSRGYT